MTELTAVYIGPRRKAAFYQMPESTQGSGAAGRRGAEDTAVLGTRKQAQSPENLGFLEVAPQEEKEARKEQQGLEAQRWGQGWGSRALLAPGGQRRHGNCRHFSAFKLQEFPSLRV